jgi:hypothetical protein
MITGMRNQRYSSPTPHDMQGDDVPPGETMAYLRAKRDAFLAKLESATVAAEYFGML